MKFGGPWNLRGLNPETREVARDAARRSGQSVGEWLNSVIQPNDTDDRAQMRSADYDEDDGRYRRDDSRRRPRHDDRYGRPRRPRRDDDEPSRVARRHPDRDDDDGSDDSIRRDRHEIRDRDDDAARQRDRQQRRQREADAAQQRDRHQRRERERTASRQREARERRERERERETALALEEFGEVHARLDRLTQQIDRMTRNSPVRLTGAPPPRGHLNPSAPRPPIVRPVPLSGSVTVDDAIAEITDRQRQLYGDAPAYRGAPLYGENPGYAEAPLYREAPPTVPAAAPHAAPVAPPAAPALPADSAGRPEPGFDLSKLGDQLRDITVRIGELRPSSELEQVITAFRADLAEIRHQITEALPRNAMESLEGEVQSLAQRIDRSRESGVDTGVVAGLERGLSEVRDALRGLTPAENLVGFDDAVRTLAQKVDLIIAKDDPATLQQLETAIGALRGIVSHVASNDTLTKVAEDVQTLAEKVDSLALGSGGSEAFAQLESRIDSLTEALHASAEAGQAMPRELEKLLSGLVDKLERSQLTTSDQTALGQFEDRVAKLIKRLDASDARLGNLEAIERGLADLLVHLDQIRGGTVELKRSERRTQDSLEAVHGTVEQVVDRLAMIESDIHDKAREPAARPAPAPAAVMTARPVEAGPAKPALAPQAIGAPAVATPKTLVASPPAMAASAPAATPASAMADSAPPRAAAPRKPIDPNLPPDHPLEPGSASGPRIPSAADRIAASEAAADFAKPPVLADPGDKPNFIAAARRAAQAAAAAAPERQGRGATDDQPAGKPKTKLRTILVAGGAVLVLAGVVHIALHMFQDGGSAGAPRSEQAAPPAVVTNSDATKLTPSQPGGPLVLPVPGAASDTAPAQDSGADTAPAGTPNPTQGATPDVAPDNNPAAPPAGPAPAAPSRQSSLQDLTDVTGSLPRHAAPPAIIAPAQAPADAANAIDKLPATIGGPTLRAAALAGDVAAEYEVATRFIEGRGVAMSNEQAARWLERAAKQGLAPAQFRLGGFYEKGLGVKKDLAAARDLYRAAADKGNGKAMHNLAVLYAEGVNGQADYRTAAQWFRKAAERGITDSQYNLAILYARGIGVEQNYAESYKWFVLAANQGDAEAARKRDEVATHLDPQTLAAAQAAVQKWTAEPQPNDAVNVKTPPGGWDPTPQAAKPKPRQHAANTL